MNHSSWSFSLRPRPETDPRHSAHSLRVWEGNDVQFKRTQRSGAAATRSSLPSAGSRWCHLNGRWAADVWRLELSFMHLSPIEEWVIRSSADHGLTTRSPMASGGFSIAAHVRLHCTFPLDWTCASCRKYVTKVTSVRQFRLNSSLYVSGPIGRAGAPRSFFLCVTMPGNASRRRTTRTQLHFLFPSMRWAQCIGLMDKRTELAQKAHRALYIRCRLYQIHIDFFLMDPE